MSMNKNSRNMDSKQNSIAENKDIVVNINPPKELPVERSTFCFAIKNNNFELAELMVQKGVDVNEPGIYNLTPLHLAVDCDRPDMIIYLVSVGADLNSVIKGGNLDGFTPLYSAVLQNHLECVKVLLELGARVTSEIEEESIYHPLHYAVFFNYVDAARILLQHGADANLRFSNEFLEQRQTIMDPLLWRGHDLPLFHYSILQNYQEMAQLLSTYADINSRTRMGKTALMQAVEVNDIDWVKALATKENVNDRDNFGQPVLHFTMVNANRKASMYSKKEFALYPQRVDVLKILLLSGADFNARFPENQEHSSIVHYMVKYLFFEGVRCLIYFALDFDFNQIDNFTLLSGKILSENLTPDILNDQFYFSQITHRSVQVIYNIIQRAIELQMIGLPVDKTLILERPFYPWMEMEKHTQLINEQKHRVELQINIIKETKVGDTNITIWELLTCDMNKLVKYMSNKSVRDLNFSANPDLKTILYRSIFLKRFRHARKLRMYLDETTELVATSFINCIPFDCSEKIANFIVYNKDDKKT